MKINTILDEKYENSYILNFENNQEVCHGNIIKNNGILEKCNNKTRHYINQRVTALLYRIEELQGTNRVNLLA